MSDTQTFMSAQVIVPAYVWQDEPQRAAVCVASARTLEANVTAQGGRLAHDLADAEVHPHFLQAQVGQVGDTKFVAYEQCEPGLADLVFLTVTIEVTQ